MPAISLRDVIDALNLESDELHSYLDPETAEIITFNLEQEGIARRGDWNSQPAWMQESLPKIKRAIEGQGMLRLPDRVRIDEWKIMRDFAEEQDSRKASAELSSVVDKPDAFLLFNRAIERLKLEQEWSKHRAAAIERIAREWLEQHRLVYR